MKEGFCEYLRNGQEACFNAFVFNSYVRSSTLDVLVGTGVEELVEKGRLKGYFYVYCVSYPTEVNNFSIKDRLGWFFENRISSKDFGQTAEMKGGVHAPT